MQRKLGVILYRLAWSRGYARTAQRIFAALAREFAPISS